MAGPKGYIHGWIRVGGGPTPRPEAVKKWSAAKLPQLRKWASRPGISDQDRADIHAAIARKEGTHKPRVRAGLGTGHEALQPKAWTHTSHDRTAAALSQTEDGRVLTKIIDSFQSGHAVAVPRLRADIEKSVNGGHLDPGRQRAVGVLLSAVNGTSSNGQALRRGMAVPGRPEAALARYKPGSSVNISLGSFSSSPQVADRFTRTSYGKKVSAATTTPVTVIWPKSDRALPIQNLAPNSIIASEKEWLVSGRFEVVSSRRTSQGVQVIVRRVGAL